MRIIFWMLIIMLTSCLDKIDLNVPKEAQEILVVQGGIYRYNNHAEVKAQMRITSDQYGQSRTTRIQQAFIENEMGQKKFLEETGDGIYSIIIADNSIFNIEYGTKFRIVVLTLSNELYMSDFKTLQKSPKIDALKYKVTLQDFINTSGEIIQREYVNLYVDCKLQDDNGNKSILKFDILNNFKYTDQLWGGPPGKLCYVIQRADISNVKLYDARQSNQTYLENFSVYDRPLDYVFSEGYYGTVVLQNIDQDAYNYYTQINALGNREGTIYDPPVGRISTNMHNATNPDQLAFGYFDAVAQDTARIYISPDEVGNPARTCPVLPSETSICPVRSCCDCLLLKGASLEKPLFWK